MKKIIFYTVAISSLFVAPIAANAGAMTLHCSVGDIKIADAGEQGFAKASFRRESYSSGETLCDRKLNVYCAVDRSNPDIVRLTRTVRLGDRPDGEIMVSFVYSVDTRANTLTTHIADRYGDVFSQDPVSACSVGTDEKATKLQTAMRAPAWPLKVLLGD